MAEKTLDWRDELAGDDDGRNRRRSAARSRLVIAWHVRYCEPTRARAALPRAERGAAKNPRHGLVRVMNVGSAAREKSALTPTADVMRSRHKRRDGPITVSCTATSSSGFFSDCVEDRSIALLLPSTPVEIGRAG